VLDQPGAKALSSAPHLQPQRVALPLLLLLLLLLAMLFPLLFPVLLPLLPPRLCMISVDRGGREFQEFFPPSSRPLDNLATLQDRVASIQSWLSCV
jgi:hypothetical protein